MAALECIDLNIELTFNLIETKYLSLTDYEKSAAISNGYCGKYGQCYKLTPHIFLSWIAKFEADKNFGTNNIYN